MCPRSPLVVVLHLCLFLFSLPSAKYYSSNNNYFIFATKKNTLAWYSSSHKSQIASALAMASWLATRIFIAPLGFCCVRVSRPSLRVKLSYSASSYLPHIFV